MLGFFSLFCDGKEIVKKDHLYFVSIPDNLPEDEIRERFARLAQSFANKVDANIVFLNYGKEGSIRYEYKI